MTYYGQCLSVLACACQVDSLHCACELYTTPSHVIPPAGSLAVRWRLCGEDSTAASTSNCPRQTQRLERILVCGSKNSLSPADAEAPAFEQGFDFVSRDPREVAGDRVLDGAGRDAEVDGALQVAFDHPV